MRTIGEIVAVVGILLGLVFVGLEIRQNTDMMKAQTRSEITQSIIGLIEMERHPSLVEAQLRIRRGEELSEEQLYLYQNMANATLRVWENTYYQHSAGLFEDDEFQADLVVWREQMTDPIWVELWRGTRTTYSAQFRDEIDRLVSITP